MKKSALWWCQNYWLLSKSCNELHMFDWKKTSDDKNALLKRGVTGDETWIYEYDVELKSQSKEWKKKMSQGHKSVAVRSKNQSFWLCSFFFLFFYGHRIVHHELVPEAQFVNAAFYVEVLRPNLSKVGHWILHYNNTPAHSALIVCVFERTLCTQDEYREQAKTHERSVS